MTLLRAATGSPLLVELKGGDTYNGRLVSMDAWMNMNLTDVICTAADGQTFTRLPQGAYIRGSAIKYLRLPPALLQEAAVQEAAAQDERRQQSNFGGSGRGGRGRGRGGGRCVEIVRVCVSSV